MNEDINNIVSLVVESWRLSRIFRDVLPKLNDEDSARCMRRYSWFRRRLDEIADSFGLRIVELSHGDDYDPGMAVTPVNISDFTPNDSLQIDNMTEPIIMSGNSVVKTGTVMLRRTDQ